MCRLFPSELIETIATGQLPAPHDIAVVAGHIRRDWRDTVALAQTDKPHVAAMLAEIAMGGVHAPPAPWDHAPDDWLRALISE